jgi:DNA mismatch endonuclease, patch repair protein
MQGNGPKDTRPEVAIRSLLHRRGLRFRKHARPLGTLRCRADLVFPRDKVAVFVDGCFWHACPQHGHTPRSNSDYWSAKLTLNAERDARNSAALKGEGWKVVRAWEHEDPMAVAAQIEEVVRSRRQVVAEMARDEEEP